MNKTMDNPEKKKKSFFKLPSPKIFHSSKKYLPEEISIFFIFIGIALLFEVLGWILLGRSFLSSPTRLFLMVLQVSVIGLLAIGVTHVIITGGIDLSSGSVLGLVAVVAASLAQSSDATRAVYPSLLGLPAFIPIAAGIIVGGLCGLINGSLIALTGIPPFIATLGMMVSARGVAEYYTTGKPISNLTSSFNFWGSGWMPVIIFLFLAAIGHIMLSYTKYGKYTYAIGGNESAARISGINVKKYKIYIYTFAGLLAGVAGVVHSARVQNAGSSMGLSYELDAIAAAVIGGTSLTGGVGRIPGTIIGALILGLMKSGFTFLGVDAYIQEIIKGIIIVGAVVTDVMKNKKST
jgi:inositol transport system permease protein